MKSVTLADFLKARDLVHEGNNADAGESAHNYFATLSDSLLLSLQYASGARSENRLAQIDKDFGLVPLGSSTRWGDEVNRAVDSFR